MDGLRNQVELRCQRIAFADADQLADVMSRFGSRALQLSRAIGPNTMFTAELGPLRFNSASTSGRYRLEGGTPSGYVILQFDRGSDGPRRVNGLALGADDMFVGYAGAEFDMVSSNHYRGMTFSLPEALVARALACQASDGEEAIRSSPLQAFSGSGLPLARIRALADEVIFRDEVSPHIFGVSEFAYNDLVDTLFDALRLSRQREQAGVRTSSYRRLPIVRRVEEFMRINLGEPIFLHDLCEAGGASERAMEYAFRDVYGMGAKRYLKLLRLNEVRRQLKILPRDTETIAAIAFRHGFWHLGHFWTSYRQFFGETPQNTRDRSDTGHSGSSRSQSPRSDGFG